MKLSIHSKSLSKRFVNVFTNLGNLTDTLVLQFNDNGLYVQGIDNSHVSLYEANFDKNWFSTYKREEEDAAQISVSLDYFKKILSTKGDDQLIYLEYKGESPDLLTIIFRSIGKETKDFPREYEMALMDIDTEMIEIPNDEQSVQFYIDTKLFSSLVKQLNMFDETVVITCNEEEIKFSSKGPEGSMNVNLFDNDKDYVDQFMIDEDYSLKISFALRYFEHFSAFQKVSSRVRLSFTNAYPVEVFYSLETSKEKEKEKEKTEHDDNGDDDEQEDPKSYLRLLLAPKITDDADDDDDDVEDVDDVED